MAKASRQQVVRVVVLSGAGISQESGIDTFRATDGLWENHAIEDVATPEGFARNPNLVYQFYNQRIIQLKQPTVAPNAAHKALAALANTDNVVLTLVTQNVDDLHERAGSREVLHMHGSLVQARCTRSQQVHPVEYPYSSKKLCQCCLPPQPLRPNIVWFGEMPFYMEQIEQALFNADVFIAIGTSGNVYPAAGFVDLAQQFGAKTIELNLQPSERQSLFDEAYYGPATEIVPAYLQQYIG